MKLLQMPGKQNAKLQRLLAMRNELDDALRRLHASRAKIELLIQAQSRVEEETRKGKREP